MKYHYYLTTIPLTQQTYHINTHIHTPQIYNTLYISNRKWIEKLKKKITQLQPPHQHTKNTKKLIIKL